MPEALNPTWCPQPPHPAAPPVAVPPPHCGQGGQGQPPPGSTHWWQRASSPDSTCDSRHNRRPHNADIEAARDGGLGHSLNHMALLDRSWVKAIEHVVTQTLMAASHHATTSCMHQDRSSQLQDMPFILLPSPAEVPYWQQPLRCRPTCVLLLLIDAMPPFQLVPMTVLVESAQTRRPDSHLQAEALLH